MAVNILIVSPQDDQVILDFMIESKGQMSQAELGTRVHEMIAARWKILEEKYEP